MSPPSGTVFRILVYAKSSAEPLVRSLALSRETEVRVLPLAAGIRSDLEASLSLVWIGREYDLALQFARRARDVSFSDGLLAVGQDLPVRDAAPLVKAGFEMVFDLKTDANQLLDEVLARYEAWCSRPQAVSVISQGPGETPVLGVSTQMRRLHREIALARQRRGLTILLTGETGTGKQVVARAIHGAAHRRKRPFVEVNCSALPESMLETELFGHEKGAFTDARQVRRGIFEMAHGGTLFLDEVSAMPLSLQAKLLKVVEQKSFRRLGGEKEIRVDCQIIAGSNVDLEAEARDGTFRKDLYYRLNVFPICLPPLRVRGAQDIELLARAFLKSFRQQYDLEVESFSPVAMAALRLHDWPGNVRELRHVVERAAVLSQGPEVTLHELPDRFSHLSDAEGERLAAPGGTPAANAGLAMDAFPGSGIGEEGRCSAGERRDARGLFLRIEGLTLAEIECRVVAAVLEAVGGNRSEAARRLGISRSRLLRRIARLKESDDGHEAGPSLAKEG